MFLVWISFSFSFAYLGHGGALCLLLCNGGSASLLRAMPSTQVLQWRLPELGLEKPPSSALLQGVGEPGFDWEVKESTMAEGGLGVFALRPFLKDEIIMAERSIFTVLSCTLGHSYRVQENDIPITARPAVQRLHPPRGTLTDKLLLNGMSLADATATMWRTGLFICMSRVNHACIGNSLHRFLENRRVKILVASRDIGQGEEITFSYVAPEEGREAGKLRLRLQYGFTCCCRACTNPEVEAELKRMKDLDQSIMRLGGMGQVEVALQRCETLIKLYNKYEESSWLYYRTYYDMYQVAITKRKSFKRGVGYIKKAYEAVLAFTLDPDNIDVLTMKAYVDAPHSHRNFSVLD